MAAAAADIVVVSIGLFSMVFVLGDFNCIK